MMAAALPFLAIAGTVVGAAGSVYKGFYQGQVAENNKEIALERANYAKQAGNQQATLTALKGASENADIKTAIAANGVDVNTGSADKVLTSHRIANELDVDTVLHNANLEAYGYTVEADNLQNEANLSRTMGIVGGVGDLLTGAGSFKMPGGGGGGGGDIGSWGNARTRLGFTLG
jgi:hypothetical protein